MKRIALIICAIFAVAAIGCQDVEHANDKIQGCLEDEYGEEEAESMMEEWELTCEDGEEECDTCVDCIFDNECEEILDDACTDKCAV